jgi:hypothetical protein
VDQEVTRARIILFVALWVFVASVFTIFTVWLARSDAPTFAEPLPAPSATAAAESASAPATLPPGIRRPWTGTGTMAVGADGIPPGAYLVTAEGGANGCYWARLSRDDDDPKSIIDQGHFDRGGYAKPVIHPHDKFFRVSGCFVDVLS